MPRVALVHAVVRSGGASTRLRWWHDLLGLLDAEVVEVPLVPAGERILPRGIGRTGALVAGTVAPESLVWSSPALRDRLAVIDPDAVVVVSLRAFDRAGLPSGIPVVLDYVDRLSASYRQRATVERHRYKRVAWLLLARAMLRAEVSTRSMALVRVAAGRGDAAELGAVWLPITVASSRLDRGPHPAGGERSRSGRRWDALFTGTLDYGPNVAALRALAGRIWPEVVRLRPRSTLCVAGRRPTGEVRELVTSMGADLVDDFADFDDLASRTTVALAPLPLATGMQIKVLEAAAAGLPQVVSPVAVNGLAPGFPARVAEVGTGFAHQVVDLLDDPMAATDLGRRGTEEVRAHYTHEHWAPRVAALFGWEASESLPRDVPE